MVNIAFLGLGIMGAPMARHLIRAGHNVIVFNRTIETAQQWVKENGGSFAATPHEAAHNAHFVISCVSDDSAVESMIIGENGAFSSMKPDSIFIDHTTISAQTSRDIYSKASHIGISFLDAPVSGGQLGAENGQLSVMIGGDHSAYLRAMPILSHYSKAINYMGESGAGQLTKMINQICIAGLLQGLAEGLHFCQCAGLNPDDVLAAISQGAAGSWQMNNRWHTMANDQFNFGFAVDHMRKDLAICIEEAKRNGANLPITKIVDTYYADIQTLGGHKWDTSSLIRRLNKPLNESEPT